MKHIFFNMKTYWVSVLAILILLIAQAFCDFALPNYTSDLIDTGITNNGIEYATPDEISIESYAGIATFMTEEEKDKWEESYAADGKTFVLAKGADKEELDEFFTHPIAVYYMLSNMPEDAMKQMAKQEQGTIPDMMTIRAMMEEQLDKMGDSIVSKYAIQFTSDEYVSLGKDLNKIRNKYLWKKGGFMILFTFGMGIISVIIGFIASKIGAKTGADLRKRVFAKITKFSDAEINKFSIASLITRTTNDVQQVQQVTVLLLRMVLYAPILAIGGIIMVTKTRAGMGYIIGIAIGAIALLMGVLMFIAFPKFKVMQKLVDKVNLVTREILTGLPVIRAFSREKTEEERFDEANTNLTKVMLFTNRTMTFMMPVLMIIMNGVSILIVWTGAHKIDTGAIEIGQMTAFISYTMMIVMSFLMLTMISIVLPRAGVAADRIHEVLTTDFSIMDKEDAVTDFPEKAVVKFDNVSFTYPGAEDKVLENISFTAAPGTTTAIIGSTGCGKSTLVNLILRFYDVTDGRITIDGIDVRDFSQHTLREGIGYVPQKGILFSGTIKENIKYADDDISDESMYDAARISQSEEFIEEKTEQYDTVIAQGGSNVSGGQKQRLSIARAIAKDPMIYIFDDSFSALDFKTDVALRKALGPKVKDKTVFIVAQRISTVLNAEQIIVLDEGKMVGIGTHKELMKNCEVYNQIASSQLSEKELQDSMEEA